MLIKKLLRVFGLIKFLFSKKISFSEPKKKEVIILDDVSSKDIIPLVNEYSYSVLPVRKDNMCFYNFVILIF